MEFYVYEWYSKRASTKPTGRNKCMFRVLNFFLYSSLDHSLHPPKVSIAMNKSATHHQHSGIAAMGEEFWDTDSCDYWEALKLWMPDDSFFFQEESEDWDMYDLDDDSIDLDDL